MGTSGRAWAAGAAFRGFRVFCVCGVAAALWASGAAAGGGGGADGPDGLPMARLAGRGVASMKAVRKELAARQASYQRAYGASADNYRRIRAEQGALKRRLDDLAAEFREHGEDEAVGDALAECDERYERKGEEALRAKVDMELLKKQADRARRELSALNDLIRKCESQGKVVAAAEDFEAFRRRIGEARGAAASVDGLRSDVDGRLTDLEAEEAAEKERRRKRLEKYRK